MAQASYPLPRPISTNGLYANVQGKGRVKSERYKTWINAAGWEIKSGGPIRKIPGPVSLDFTIPRPRSTIDLDNCLKAYIDLLVNLGAIDDDRNLVGVSAEWGESGRVHIRGGPDD